MIASSSHPPSVDPSHAPAVSEAVLLLDRQATILFATPAMAELYGYALPEIIGQPVNRFIAPESAEHLHASWELFLADPTLKSYQIYGAVVTRTGQRAPVRASLWRLPGNEDLFLSVHHIYDRLRDRLDHFYALSGILASTLEINALLDSILRVTHRMVPCDTISVYITEPDATLSIRRLHNGQIETERSLPREYLPEFPTSTYLRETGQALIIYDTASDPRWVTQPGGRPIRSWLGAPLIHRGEYLGELALDSPVPGTFEPDDSDLVLALAVQVAAAVHNARQFESEQHRARHFQALSEVSQAISRLELDAVLDLVYQRVSALMDADGFFIGLYDAVSDTIRVAGFYDKGVRQPDSVHSAQEGLAGLVLRSGRSLILHDLAHDALADQAVLLGELPSSVLMMPLITQGEAVGVITVQSYTPYTYTPDDAALLEAIAGAVATAVRNAQLFDQTRMQLHALEALHRLSLDLAGTQNPDTVAQMVTRAALDLLHPDQARLCLCEEGPWATTLWIYDRGGKFGSAPFSSAVLSGSETYLEQVRASQKPLILPDLSRDPALRSAFDTPWPVQAAMLQPVMRAGRYIGVLALLYTTPQVFPETERHICEMLCLQAASAFEGARYTIDLTRRLQEVTALHELARRVGEIESQEEILQAVVHTVRDALNCKSASVALLEPDGQTVSLRAGAGLEPRFVVGHTFALGEYVAGAVVATGQTIYVPDTLADPHFRVIDPSVRALMSVPLTVQRRTIGALNIDAGQTHAFTPDHERVLMIAGGQIAAAIENLRLLEEARERATQLAEANASLQAQDEFRRELVFQVTHDLRGPLQIIIGYADMMRDEILGPTTATQQDVLGLILKRSKSIERMTHDILAARPIDAEALELEPIDLNEICQQSLVDVQMTYPGAHHVFKSDLQPGPLIVMADYNRLSRVFDNLIGNAVKFSPDGGEIVLRTTRDEAQGTATVSISDPGIGIAPEKLPYIFERFYRGDMTFRKRFEGTGLGLYIVQQIVQAHAGTLAVESQEGVGSTFSFSLPLLSERD